MGIIKLWGLTEHSVRSALFCICKSVIVVPKEVHKPGLYNKGLSLSANICLTLAEMVRLRPRVRECAHRGRIQRDIDHKRSLW